MCTYFCNVDGFDLFAADCRYNIVIYKVDDHNTVELWTVATDQESCFVIIHIRMKGKERMSDRLYIKFWERYIASASNFTFLLYPRR